MGKIKELYIGLVNDGKIKEVEEDAPVAYTTVQMAACTACGNTDPEICALCKG